MAQLWGCLLGYWGPLRASAGFDQVGNELGVSDAGGCGGPAEELVAGWPGGHLLVAGGWVVVDVGVDVDVDGE